MAACAGRRCHAKSSGPIELLKLGDGVRSRSRELRSGTSIKISWSKRSGRLQLGTHLMRDFALARAYARIPEFAPDSKPGSLDLARSPEKREYSVHIKDRENPGTREGESMCGLCRRSFFEPLGRHRHRPLHAEGFCVGRDRRSLRTAERDAPRVAVNGQLNPCPSRKSYPQVAMMHIRTTFAGREFRNARGYS